MTGAGRYSAAMAETLPDPIPAATLVLVRDAPDGAEVLMIERAAAMAFAGGAVVFPGGRIDPADITLAETLFPDREDAAARIAAIRETLEEVGIAVAMTPLPGPNEIAAMRAALHGGAPMAAVLGTRGLVPDDLVPFARWLPRHPGLRIYDTRFFLAALPDGASPGEADRTETVSLTWLRPADALAAADAGTLRLIYPTRRNLERLALFPDHAAAVAHAHAHPVRTITPFTAMRDGQPHLCIPEDHGYPVTAEPLGSAMRS